MRTPSLAAIAAGVVVAAAVGVDAFRGGTLPVAGGGVVPHWRHERTRTTKNPPPVRAVGQRRLCAVRTPPSSSGPFGILEGMFNIIPAAASNDGGAPSALDAEGVVTSFLSSINSRESPSSIVDEYFDEGVEYVDASYYNTIVGKDALRRHFLLHAGSSPLSTLGDDGDGARFTNIAVDDVASSQDGDGGRVCVMYHLTAEGGVKVDDSAAISFYNVEGGKITSVFDVAEPPSPKPGDSGLKLLRAVSGLMGGDAEESDDTSDAKATATMTASSGASTGGSAVERYFESWNRRDMAAASSCFDVDCVARDLQYDAPLAGRAEVEEHLLRVADCLPPSFSFVVDDMVVTPSSSTEPTKVGVRWHVNNDGAPLAFTRGCSFYVLDERSGLIKYGYEVPEKAPPKLGYWNTVASRFESEPARLAPLALWAAYMYVLFLSDGILPGANALALERRTWEEVRDLSLNFFLVAPALKGLGVGVCDFSPVVHPMLEGVFNLLLSWAAMFAGFLSDERKDKPNLLPFGPMLVGMQFLTSGFLLPYLFLRTPEKETLEGVVYREDIDGELQARVAEYRPLGGLLGGVGTLSILWGFLGRPEFGEFSERYASFGDLLSIDRVGSSFIVDLVIFAIFQSWFVDEDLKRRGVTFEADADVNGEVAVLRNVAKFVPFFGLASYLTFRPSLPERREDVP